MTLYFYSHAPRGARRGTSDFRISYAKFLLTRPSRGATGLINGRKQTLRISTHTPLAGRDGLEAGKDALSSHFYSHAPRGARREAQKLLASRFHNFYSHAPRGARPFENDRFAISNHFYSHAPRGARHITLLILLIQRVFLLTRPSRGATPSPYRG